MIKYKYLLTAACGVLFFTGLAVADDVIDQEVIEIDAAAISQGESKVKEKFSSEFTEVAGSTENADALVTGLRNGGDIDLDGTTVENLAGLMGYGNIKIAIVLTESQLGEGYTTAEFAGVLNEILQARADGGGWGEIAKDMGLTVGQLMGKADKGLANKPIRSEKSAKAAKPLRVEKISKPLKVGRPDKPERLHRPDRPGKG